MLRKFSLPRLLAFVCSALLTILISAKVSAQAPDFLWAKQGSGELNDVARGVTVDDFDNSIATGSFQGKIELDARSLISAGRQDIFLAKYNGKGEINWLRQFGAQGRDFAFDIVEADSKGNSFVTGLFSDTVNFDQFTLQDAGGGDMFTAKIDPAGKVLWAKQAGGPDLDGGNEVATDAVGNAVIIANTYGSVKIEDVLLKHQGKQDIFLTKYDPNGKFLWARQMAGPGEERGRGVAADKQNNVVTTGEFVGPLSFGQKSQKIESFSSLKDVFLAKYDASGKFLWGKSFGSAGEDYGRGVGTDEAGNIYFSGVFSGKVKFGNHILSSLGGSKDIFLAKADASGSVIWARQMGGYGPDEGCEIEVDEAGNSYISGGFAHQATFESKVLNSEGFRDVFVAKYDSQGKLVWLKQGGGKGDDEDYAIALNSGGKVTIVGTFYGEAKFGDFVVKSFSEKAAFFVAQLARSRS